MSVPGVQAKQMERAMARSTSSAGSASASAREGTAKSIVADQISHAVQSTSNLLHLIQQPFLPMQADKAPRNLLAKASRIKNNDQILQY